MTGQMQQYGYFVYLAFLYSALVVVVSKKADLEKRDRRLALDVSMVLMIFGFLGGRMLHVIWEAPFYYKNNLFEILKFWQGGFVFFGGALFAVLASFLFLKSKNEEFWPWADFFTPIASIGYALGRVSCLISGCCYGSSCELWRPLFEKHPTQIYAIVAELVAFSIIMSLRRKLTTRASGLLFLSWAILHSIGRLVMEYFRDDFRGYSMLNLTLGSVISLSIILISTILIFVKLYIIKNPKEGI